MYIVTYTYAFTKYEHKIISVPSCLYIKYEFRVLGIYDFPMRLTRKLCIKRSHTRAHTHSRTHMFARNRIHMTFEDEAFISFLRV
jgi:hypothetical protein